MPGPGVRARAWPRAAGGGGPPDPVHGPQIEGNRVPSTTAGFPGPMRRRGPGCRQSEGATVWHVHLATSMPKMTVVGAATAARHGFEAGQSRSAQQFYSAQRGDFALKSGEA